MVTWDTCGPAPATRRRPRPSPAPIRSRTRACAGRARRPAGGHHGGPRGRPPSPRIGTERPVDVRRLGFRVMIPDHIAVLVPQPRLVGQVEPADRLEPGPAREVSRRAQERIGLAPGRVGLEYPIGQGDRPGISAGAGIECLDHVGQWLRSSVGWPARTGPASHGHGISPKEAIDRERPCRPVRQASAAGGQ
jgi:hypothetical protein